MRLRGLRYERREEGGIPREDLDRIDLLWAAAMGFGPVDPIPATLFQVKQLLLVLHAGEPYRLVRALAHEAVFLSHRGLRSERETGRVLSLALEEAERLGQPEPLGRAYIGAGIAAILQGRWKAGAGLLDRAEHLLREGTAGLHYEIHLAQFQALVGYSVMGDLPELSRRLPGLVLEARSKGDLLALANLRAGHAYLLFLAQDRPEMAREALVEAMGAWSSRGFHAQHYNELVSLVNIELYEGSPLRARAQLEAAWSALRRSMLLRVQAIGITCRELRARTLLGLELEKPGSMDARGWRQLGSDIRAIEAEKTPYGHALVLRLQGLALLARGREGEAHPVLLQSELAFEGSDMRLHALTVRMLRGSLHGRAGEGLREAARTDLQALGVVSPERFLRMHLPVPRPQ
nr:hypothetical protein [uncultured Holophaga sp.]